MFGRLLGDPNARKLRRFSPLVSDINSLEEDLTGLSDSELKNFTSVFRQKLEKATSDIERGHLLDDLLPEAFSVVREASKRVLCMRHFDVQLIG